MRWGIHNNNNPKIKPMSTSFIKEEDNDRVNIMVVDDKEVIAVAGNGKSDFANVMDYDTRNFASNENRDSI
jgi:hypothetical protein